MSPPQLHTELAPMAGTTPSLAPAASTDGNGQYYGNEDHQDYSQFQNYGPYDMDEQDDRWLQQLNTQRREEGVEPIKPAIFEVTITQIEKEWHALEKRKLAPAIYEHEIAN